MYAKSLALASAVAMAASVAAVQPEHPRIYFPREIKREYHNSTVTSRQPLSSTPNVMKTTATSSSSTRRDLLSDLISEILGPDQPTSSTTEKPPVTTVVDSTVTPGRSSSGSGPSKETVLPTSKINESSTKPSTRSRPSTEPGIVIGPTGIVSPTGKPRTTVESKTTFEPPKITSVDLPVSNITVPETDPTTPATVKESSVPTEAQPTKITSVDSTVSNTVPQAKPTAPTTVAVPTTTGEPATKFTSVDVPVGNSTVSEAIPTTSSGGILDPIGTLLSSLLPGPPSTTTSSTSMSTKTDSPEQPIPQNSTTPAVPTTDTSIDALPSLTSLLPTSLLPIPGKTTTTSDAGPLPNATSTEVPVTATTPPPGSTITNLPTATTTDVPISNSTSTTVGTTADTTAGTVTSAPTATDVPVTNGTISEPPTSTATSLLTTPISVPNDNSTVGVGPTTTPNPGTVIPTTKTEASTTVATTVVPTPTSEVEVTSIRPTATLPSTDKWLPTTVVIEPTTFSFSSPTSNPSETSTQALPTTIPKVIKPGSDQDAHPPEGTVPIHIGFNYSLHYVFLASTPGAASQIFDYLPRILANASGYPVEKLAVTELLPYNTLATKGWVTTLAKLNYPKTMLSALELNVKTPSSPIYQNPEPILAQFAKYIDASIPLTGNLNDGGSSGNGGTGSGNNGNNGNNNNNNDAFGSGNQGDQTSKQKATTAGIAVAAVGLSALYGAAMFIVARRYKRKRQGHRRASSISSGQGSPEMRYNGNGSPALMGGALLSHDGSTYGGIGGRDSHASGGHSGRTANISAPVATENSLGWN